jgi:hypothetical protein
MEIGTFAPLKKPGLGAELALHIVAAHPYAFVPPGLDERLG